MTNVKILTIIDKPWLLEVDLYLYMADLHVFLNNPWRIPPLNGNTHEPLTSRSPNLSACWYFKSLDWFQRKNYGKTPRFDGKKHVKTMVSDVSGWKRAPWTNPMKSILVFAVPEASWFASMSHSSRLRQSYMLARHAFHDLGNQHKPTIQYSAFWH